jgi:hypothetical protein
MILDMNTLHLLCVGGGRNIMMKASSLRGG